MRYVALRCECLMWWESSLGIRLKSSTVKVCSTPFTYLRAIAIFLTHSLTLSLCIYLSLSLSLSHALYSYVGAVQMAAGL